jgi:hypothetical protein
VPCLPHPEAQIDSIQQRMNLVTMLPETVEELVSLSVRNISKPVCACNWLQEGGVSSRHFQVDCNRFQLVS